MLSTYVTHIRSCTIQTDLQSWANPIFSENYDLSNFYHSFPIYLALFHNQNHRRKVVLLKKKNRFFLHRPKKAAWDCARLRIPDLLDILISQNLDL